MKAYPLSWPRESSENLGVEKWFLPCISPIIRPFWKITIFNSPLMNDLGYPDPDYIFIILWNYPHI